MESAAAAGAVPSYIANSARNLYRECLRRAYYIGKANGNQKAIMALVRKEFRKHMHESDPERIKELKESAVRGLFNHMLHEAWNMSTGQADDY